MHIPYAIQVGTMLKSLCASVHDPRRSAAEGDRTALGTVMRVWTERQIELRGIYSINLTGTALALILSSRHPALDEIQARLNCLRRLIAAYCAMLRLGL